VKLLAKSLTSTRRVTYPESVAVGDNTHEWVSFEDAKEQRTWLVDVTFLTSRWNCIFGNGCKGILEEDASDLVQGCCSYGAHFTDDKDIKRVSAAVKDLRSEEWQFQEDGLRDGFIEVVDGATKTRLHHDACIFLNRPGFAGDPGCAFHIAARRQGVPHLKLQPEVCWQVPVRREDLVDELGHVTSTITQWDRRHWGEAGEDFHWWCSEAPEAFEGPDPVYVSLAPELTELMGKRNFAEVRRYLDQRLQDGISLPHPVVRQKRASS
jgi:hypothetical protein